VSALAISDWRKGEGGWPAPPLMSRGERKKEENKVRRSRNGRDDKEKGEGEEHSNQFQTVSLGKKGKGRPKTPRPRSLTVERQKEKEGKKATTSRFTRNRFQKEGKKSDGFGSNSHPKRE